MLNWKGILVAREIEDIKELSSEGYHMYRVHGQVAFSSEVRDSLARELAKLHDSGFMHGDLKTRHILTRENGDGILTIYFVDLEKTGYHPFLLGFLTDVLATRDLIQLFASLPAESGEDQKEIRTGFLDQYLTLRRLSQTRRRLINKMLRLYQTERGLDQGKTLLRVLLNKLGI
jgi:tRNA A-37 threonylcarbamoyl transferase component Bud32